MPRSPLSAALLLVACTGRALAQEEPGEFHAFVWRSAWSGAEPPAELVAPFGGVNIERDEPAEWLPASGWGFYVGHAPGRNDLYLTRDDPRWAVRAAEWYERRDPALLVRDPCLSDPVTRARMFATLDLTIEARSADFGLGLSLGDEVGLTPWGSPSDVCRSEHCEELWEAWCARRGLEPGPAPLTDAARVALEEDELGTVARWLARRRFHQDNVLALLAELSQHAAAATHGAAPSGLMGLAGRTAFGGVDVARATALLDFVEPYDTLRSRELAFSRRLEGQVLRTVFVGADGAAGAAWQVWEHALRGGDGVVLWNDRLLVESPAVHQELGLTLTRVRALRRELEAPGAQLAPRGVALVEQANSQALCWLRDALADGATWPKRYSSYHERMGRYERAHNSWVRLFQDAGLSPGALELDAIDARTVERFPLLVLSHLEVLDEDEVARLEQYAAAGGRLLCEGQVGWMDSAGRRWGDSPIERWRRAGSDVVLPVPEGLGEYLDSRLDGKRARVGLLRETARGWLRALDSRPPPVRLDDGGLDLPWLYGNAVDAEQGGVLIALPNLTQPDERALQLVEVELALTPDAGWSLRWIAPPADARGRRLLPAGQAAVVELARLPR